MKKLKIINTSLYYGVVGEETDLKDIDGVPLFVGDLVSIESPNIRSINYDFIVKPEDESYAFVMGIKTGNKTIPKQYTIKKIQDHKNWVVGSKHRNIEIVE